MGYGNTMFILFIIALVLIIITSLCFHACRVRCNRRKYDNGSRAGPVAMVKSRSIYDLRSTAPVWMAYGESIEMNKATRAHMMGGFWFDFVADGCIVQYP